MLIKTERYINDDGIAMKKEYYGPDENTITATIESADVDESELVLDNQQEETPTTNEEESVSQDEVLAQILLNQVNIMQRLQNIEIGTNSVEEE